MRYRPKEPFIPKQQRKQYVSAAHCFDKNLERRINIKFCVKIGKRANETLALLTLAYGEYAMKKSSVLYGIDGSRVGEKMCKMSQ
jgi:polyphosphate kinase